VRSDIENVFDYEHAETRIYGRFERATPTYVEPRRQLDTMRTRPGEHNSKIDVLEDAA